MANNNQQQQPQIRRFPRKKYCYFCANKDVKIDYKDPELLRKFITDRGKIIPSRITGTCSYHQRQLARAIKRARIMALLPFTTVNDYKREMV